MKKLRAVLSLLPMLLMGALTPNAVYANSIPALVWPSDDTFIWGPRYPHYDYNFGSDTSLQIERTVDIQEILVRFDLSTIPSGATIESATLKLYFHRAFTPHGTVYAYRITSPWSEGSVTWNTRPGLESTATDSIYIDSTGWKTWDVTIDVQDFVSGTKTNYGWQLKANAAIGDTDAFSKEYTLHSYDPVLEITYKAPTTTTVDTDPRTVNKIGSETTKIFGYLTSGGTGLVGKMVKLYHQYASTDYGTPSDGTWTYIASVSTTTGGYYEYNWNPGDTLPIGYYWIKAVFEGDSHYSGSSATTGVGAIPNIFVIPEGPLGTMAALASMTLALAAATLYKRKRLRLPSTGKAI